MPKKEYNKNKKKKNIKKTTERRKKTHTCHPEWNEGSSIYSIDSSLRSEWQGRLLLWFKIFLIGLLLQFFLHTLFTFGFWLTWGFWNIVWLWKELFILIWASFVIFLLIQVYKKNKVQNISSLLKTIPLKTYILIFLITIAVIFWVSFITSNLINAVISIRYSMLWFFIFGWASFIGYYALKEYNQSKLLKRWRRVMKSLLVIGMFWRGLLWLIPNGLKFFWYDKFAHEGEVGASPPTVYYTEYNKWLVRNQFIFERPISYGFFLVALWPLFFMLAIKGKKQRELLWRGGLYGLNIFSTFSRAAWWAWFVQTILLFFIVYHKNWKKMLLYFGWPALLLIGVVSYFAADQITHRQFSNTGHLREIKIALQKIQENPILWAGVGSAGPASHQIKQFEPYNTENQYLQIWVEYGILGLLWWGYLYFFLHYVGFLARKDERHIQNSHKSNGKKYIKRNKTIHQYNYYIIAFSLGILGLSIENLVLHGFVDRMIVYPVMLLFWLSYGVWMRMRKSER